MDSGAAELSSQASGMRWNLITKLFPQIKGLIPTMVRIYGPPSILLLGIGIVSRLKRIPLRNIFSDPASIINFHPFLGFMSNLGILIWAATAAICFYSAALVRNKGGSREFSSFFQFAGLLTTVLMLDDLFLFHDWLAPKVLHIPQIIVLIAYGVTTLLFLTKFRELILRTDFVLLGSACVFFAMSVVIDQWLDEIMPMEHLFEDGSKFLGILGWLCYFIRTSFQKLDVGDRTPSVG